MTRDDVDQVLFELGLEYSCVETRKLNYECTLPGYYYDVRVHLVTGETEIEHSLDGDIVFRPKTVEELRQWLNDMMDNKLEEINE